MERMQDMACSHSVQRVIPVRVRFIQGMLYAAVALFTVIGTMGGLYWGALAVGTLVFSWYYMGIARATFLYELTGTRLRVQRVSGFASRPKAEMFGVFELSGIRVMAPEGSPRLEAEEQVKAYIEPSPEMLRCIRRAAPGRVWEDRACRARNTSTRLRSARAIRTSRCATTT